MPLPGSDAPSLEVEWLEEPQDLSSGTYLLDFWRSSCSGCIESIPALNELHENYPVEVVGIHSPEFGFEEEREHFRKEVDRHGIGYPVAHDAGTETWESYGNSYSTRQFMVRDGRILYTFTGKNLAGVETAIAEELGVDHRRVAGKQPGTSMEYLGFRHCRGVNGGENFAGEREFSVPDTRRKNRIYLDGTWRQEPDYLEAVDGRLFFPTDAGRVDLVADPGRSFRDVDVLVDGETLDREKAGTDLRGDSSVRVKRPGLHRLVDSRDGGEIVLIPGKGMRLYRLNFY